MNQEKRMNTARNITQRLLCLLANYCVGRAFPRDSDSWNIIKNHLMSLSSMDLELSIHRTMTLNQVLTWKSKMAATTFRAITVHECQVQQLWEPNQTLQKSLWLASAMGQSSRATALCATALNAKRKTAGSTPSALASQKTSSWPINSASTPSGSAQAVTNLVNFKKVREKYDLFNSKFSQLSIWHVFEIYSTI